MKKKIGIVGYGYVGKSTYDFFKNHYDIEIYDPYIEVGKYNDISKINECDLSIICVPTPSNEDGSVDLTEINTSLRKVDTPLIIIKSTVPPGTTEKLYAEHDKRIVFSPENVGEGNYEVPYWKGYPHPTDSKKHEYVIVGGFKKDCNEALEYFKKVMGPFAKYHQTDFRTAELMKYVVNSYLGTVVTFCNEIYEISKHLNVDYNELRELFLLDKRISRTHTIVFEDSRGYGGKCLPKDIKGLNAFSEENKYSPELIKQVIKSNEKFNEKNISNR